MKNCTIPILLFCSVLLAGCIQPPDMEDDWDWKNSDGKTVKVLVALNTERFSLPMDTPSKANVQYLEAILREQNTAHFYIGNSTVGESRIMVSVPSGKNYDVLVLAGASASGNISNGVKVLLASGWAAAYPIVYGRNTITVQMNMHTTQDSFSYTEGSNRFGYTPTISGVNALLAAGDPKQNEDIIASKAARIIPYPEPYSGPHQFPAITGITTNAALGTLGFTIEDTLPGLITSGGLYQCYYNLTYYGFSDPASRSNQWYIRRGIIDDMYTADSPYGGGIPLNTCYYVSGTGSDSNAGVTKDAPFQTLAKAIQAVRAKTLPWIKTVAVLGTLNITSESTQTYPGYSEGNSVFVIPNPQVSEYADYIRITGDPALTRGGAPAVLSGISSGKRVLFITGADTKIRFDNITITGGAITTAGGGGICIQGEADVIFESGLCVEGNQSTHGGVYIYSNGSTLTMNSGVVRNNDSKGSSGDGFDGGGVYVSGGDFTMNGGVIEKNTAKQTGGGVYVVNNGKFAMYGGTIQNNQARQAAYGHNIYRNGGTVTGVTLTGSYLDTSITLP